MSCPTDTSTVANPKCDDDKTKDVTWVLTATCTHTDGMTPHPNCDAQTSKVFFKNETGISELDGCVYKGVDSRGKHLFDGDTCPPSPSKRMKTCSDCVGQITTTRQPQNDGELHHKTNAPATADRSTADRSTTNRFNALTTPSTSGFSQMAAGSF